MTSKELIGQQSFVAFEQDAVKLDHEQKNYTHPKRRARVSTVGSTFLWRLMSVRRVFRDVCVLAFSRKIAGEGRKRLFVHLYICLNQPKGVSAFRFLCKCL